MDDVNPQLKGLQLPGLPVGTCVYEMYSKTLLKKTAIYTPLLTTAKSAILHIRPTSTSRFYSCYMNLWPQRPAAQPVSRNARPRNCLNKPSKLNSWRRSDIAVGLKVSRSEVQQRGMLGIDDVTLPFISIQLMSHGGQQSLRIYFKVDAQCIQPYYG